MIPVIEKYKREIGEIYKTFPLFFILILILVVSLFCYFLLGAITGGRSVYDSMFPDKNDIFMDYFHSIFYSMGGHPYTVWHVIYPPFITVIYGILAAFVGVEGEFADGFGIRDSYMGMASYMLFVMIGIIAIHLLFKALVKNSGTKILGEVLAVLLLLSYPVLFAVMRGNSIIYSLIFVCIFLLSYRSENKWVRYASYICLGVATGIKIFPAVLWLLVACRRIRKDSLVCMCILLVLLFVPFVFTDGTISYFIIHSYEYSSTSDYVCDICNTRDLVKMIGQNIPQIPMDVIKRVADTLIIIQYLVTLIACGFFRKIDYWEKVSLCMLSIILGFGTTASYNTIYLLPCILIFVSSESSFSTYNVIVATLFALTLILLPGFLGGLGRNIMIAVHGLSSIALFYLIAAKVVYENVDFGKKDLAP